jgi:6,7-dimethyl-8-ribityllumazine synthase
MKVGTVLAGDIAHHPPVADSAVNAISLVN